MIIHKEGGLLFMPTFAIRDGGIHWKPTPSHWGLLEGSHVYPPHEYPAIPRRDNGTS